MEAPFQDSHPHRLPILSLFRGTGAIMNMAHSARSSALIMGIGDYAN
jgi:hypothetical protein